MDWQSIQPLFTWLAEHPAWSGLIVFLIAFSESLFIVGLLVPGTVLMFGVGTLVGTGVLGIKETLFVAFIAAIAGDAVSFWIGVKYKRQLTSIWPLKNNPQYMESGEKFFKKHGGKSVLFGRFVGPVRPFIPTIAGMSGMPVKYFFLINIISAAAWAPFYLLPGIVFGASIDLATVVGTRLMVLLLVLAVSVFILLWSVHKMMIFLVPRLNAFYLNCHRAGLKSKIFGSFIGSIIDAEHAKRDGLIFFSSLLFCLFAFVLLLMAYYFTSMIAVVNVTISNLMLLAGSELNDHFYSTILLFFSWPAILLIFLYSLVLLHEQIVALKIFISLILLCLLSGLLLIELNEAFASLQIILLLSNLVFIVSFVGRQVHFFYRRMFYVFLALIGLLFFCAVIYIGEATISAVIFSVIIVIFWSTIILMTFRQQSPVLISGKKRLYLPSTILFLGLFSLAIFSDEEKISEQKLMTISWQQWMSTLSSGLPLYREDIFGQKNHMLNVQWLGDLDRIESALLQLGWEISPKANYRTILYWLKPEVTLEELANISQIHQGKYAQLVMIKYNSTKDVATVLQLWKSEFIVKGIKQNLWVGSIKQRSLGSSTIWLAKLNSYSPTSFSMALFEENLKSQNFTVQHINSESGMRIMDKGQHEK